MLGRGSNAHVVPARGGRNVHAWRGRGGIPAAGRGRGGRNVDAGSGRGDIQDACRGRGGRILDARTGRGVMPGERAWWLLFGEDMSNSLIPHLTAPPDA